MGLAEVTMCDSLLSERTQAAIQFRSKPRVSVFGSVLKTLFTTDSDTRRVCAIAVSTRN